MSNTKQIETAADHIASAAKALSVWINNGADLNGTGKATIVGHGLVQLGAAGHILGEVIAAHNGEIIDPVARRLREIADLRESFALIIAAPAHSCKGASIHKARECEACYPMI